MDILPSFQVGRSRVLALVMVLLMTFAGSMTILIMAAAPAWALEDGTEPVVNGYSPSALQPGERSGDHYLDDSPAEYYAYGESNNAYFGATMDKMDWNGDGVLDIVISAPGISTVYIYDGSSQLRFPELQGAGSDARWSLSGSSKFGTDFAIGDVNGDGNDDILIVNMRGPSGTQGFLFYGGPYVNNSVSFSPNATFNCESYGYYGSWAALADIDGDGYDDVFVGDGGYQYTMTYPPGYNYWYTYTYGQANWWFGSGSMSGTYYYYSADGRLKPAYSYGYDYGTYGYSYHYSMLGAGGVATGDMNGDGRDEVAFGSPYYWSNYNYYVGAVFVMYPGSNVRSYSGGEVMASSPYVDWVAYTGSSYFDSVGADPLIVDYNGDGLGDLTFNSGYYSYGSSYPDNGKWCWMVDGSSTIPTGYKKLSSPSSYSRKFWADGSTGFGAHAFGDYDGDGNMDIALGDKDPGTVYVLLNDQFATTSGTIEVTAISTFTIHAPRGASRFAYPVEYYRYYSYQYGHKYRTIMFLNRDGDGLDDIFVSDAGASVDGRSSAGAVYGISNFDMFGIGSFSASTGDLPDGKTFYAQYKGYRFKGSAWNKWDIYGSQMAWEFIMGNYHATVTYTNPTFSQDGGNIEVTDDEFGILEVDEDSLTLTPDVPNHMLNVEFDVLFTMNLPVENKLDVMFDARCAHISYLQLLEDIGFVKNRFMYVGDLQASIVDGADRIPIGDNSWVPENAVVELTGMRVIYNGTQDFQADFGIEPFYPSSDLFNMTLVNSLGYSDVDANTSGRDFVLSAPVGDRPLFIDFQVSEEGIPQDRFVNSIPPFTVRVDIDTPSAPPGVRVHADSFDDPNVIVDNDGDLYVTWHEPGEFNSGVDHYEIECDGVVTESETTFTKVNTSQVGEVMVKVRAIDRVGHIGEWSSSSIFIDSETLEFSGFYPGEDVCFNTLTPTVGISVTDIGGRAIIGSTVEYSVSHDGGETWSDWEGAGLELNAKVLDIRVNPSCTEGADNRIMFRASDEAGNIVASDPYMINVDISGVEFVTLWVDDSDEWEGVWLPSGSVDLKLDLHDELSGVDGTTLEYRTTTRGRADLNSVFWRSFETDSGNDVTANIGTMEFSMGDRNFIQFRVTDLVGNPLSYSPAYNIWIDTLPEPAILSPENGAEFLDGDLVTMDATSTVDPDGDELTFLWTDTVTFEGETTELILGEGIEALDRFQQELPPGEHSLVLTVSDGVHEVSSDPVLFTVRERIVPVWLSMDDTDQDGMPNYWEFTYHLGWDDDSNKDNLYNPSSMEGKSREVLYRELYDAFANQTNAVTTENDADGDGHTDFEEYLAGSDPTDALDFPVYKPVGENVKEEKSLFVPLLLAIVLLVIVILIVIIVVNSGAIKRDLENARVKEAEEEKALLENVLSSGGRDRLDRLLAAAQGKGEVLPAMGAPMAAALPSAEAAPAQPTEGQPGAAQPMTAQPMDAQPMQAAPMPEAQNMQNQQ